MRLRLAKTQGIARADAAAGDDVDARKINGRSISQAAPEDGDSLVFNGQTYRLARPMPRGWYDPRYYGAVFDGVTDDLPALQALHAALPNNGGVVHFPPGTAWLSDTWHVSKSFEWRSAGGGTLNVDTMFEVAPGRAAVALHGSQTSSDGNSSAHHQGSRLRVQSQILVHNTAGGSSLAQGIYRQFSAGGTVRKGDCYYDVAASTSVFFRAGQAGTFGAAKPAWSDTIGSQVTSNGITWTTEAFPTVHATSTAYTVGQRVYAPSDNRFYFECEQAGTSAASRPSELVGGDSAGGMAINDTVTDGTVVWRIKCAAGVLVLSGLGMFERVFAMGFTGPAVMFAGGEGMYTSEATVTDTNCFRLGHLYAQYCGVGVAAMGSNCNGWEIDRLFAINIGTVQPTPDAVIAAGYAGLGGHCIHDVSLAGGLVSSMYAQLSSGRPILKNGLGTTTLISCFEELSSRALCSGGATIIVGGSVYPDPASTNVIVLDPRGVQGRGLVENFASGGVTRTATMLSRGSVPTQSILYRFSAPTAADGVNSYGWVKGYQGPSDCWALQHTGQAFRNAYILTTSESPEGPGFVVEDCKLIGDPNRSAELRAVGSDFVIDSPTLRGGLRRVGDEFRNRSPAAATWYRRVITVQGYRGTRWTANTAYRAAVADWGIFADTVEPTATHATWTASGQQVWKCTTGGTSHVTTEPTWPGAPTPGVTTVTDGTVVWTYLGTTPAFTDIESLP